MMINIEYVLRKLRNGGVAIILTALYLMVARPRNILIFLIPYSGNPAMLGGVLVVIGVISAVIGTALKRITLYRETG